MYISYDFIICNIFDLKNISINNESYFFKNGEYLFQEYGEKDFIISFSEIMGNINRYNNYWEMILTNKEFKREMADILKVKDITLIYGLSADLLTAEYVYINNENGRKSPINHCKDLIKIFPKKEIFGFILREVL